VAARNIPPTKVARRRLHPAFLTGTKGLCTMSSAPFPAVPERIKMAAACAITGKAARALRDLATAGKIPGAAKIGGEWTFDVARLRAWICDLEQQQGNRCATVEKLPTTASGTERSFGGGRRSTGRSGDGRYEQTIQRLLRNGSKTTATAR
jgi:hypothetical protein